MITTEDLRQTLKDLDSRAADWPETTHWDTFELCKEVELSADLVRATNRLVKLAMMHDFDSTVPLLGLAATMLEAGYRIGRKKAETETLEAWMKL